MCLLHTIYNVSLFIAASPASLSLKPVSCDHLGCQRTFGCLVGTCRRFFRAAERRPFSQRGHKHTTFVIPLSIPSFAFFSRSLFQAAVVRRRGCKHTVFVMPLSRGPIVSECFRFGNLHYHTPSDQSRNGPGSSVEDGSPAARTPRLPLFPDSLAEDQLRVRC